MELLGLKRTRPRKENLEMLECEHEQSDWLKALQQQ